MEDNTTKKIADTVLRISEICEVSPHDLISRNRQRRLNEVRYIVYSYLHYEEGLSSFKIGKYFNRDRINIIRGIRILKGWTGYHTDIKHKVEDIMKKLKGGD